MSFKGKNGPHQDAVASLASVLNALHDLNADDARWVIEAACKKVGLTTPSADAGEDGHRRPGSTHQSADAERALTAPKDFMRKKSPATDVQKVACLGFYLAHFRNQREFKTADLTALNNEADGLKIGNATQAVNNATQQNHFFSPAGKGNKRITTLCEDVVDALPDQEKVKQVMVEKAPKRRKPRAAKKGTKS
jgi:hypothetical protein